MNNTNLAQIAIVKCIKDCESVIFKQNLKITRELFKFIFYYDVVSVKDRMKYNFEKYQKTKQYQLCT